MRTNLKFIGAILFTMLFFVGGFFINTAKGEAATTTIKSLGVSYSLSSPVSNINKDGSVSTMVLVGCAPKSGDLYDVNTGRPCNNNVKTVLVGCKAGSGDVFDVNTGIRCSSYIKPMLFGCALKSGDTYDINTGNRCKTTTLVTPPKTSTTAKAIPPITTTKTTVTSKAVEISPIASNIKEILPSDGSDDGLSGREKLKDSLTASAVRVGAIVSGPMSIWIILLIILILLGGSYGIYSLLRKPATTTMPLNMPAPHTATPAEKSVEKKIEQAKATQQSQPAKPATPEVKTPAPTPAPTITHTNPAPITPTTAPINTATLPNLNTPQ